MLDTPFSVGKAKENITIWYLVWINIDLNNTSKRLMSQLSIKTVFIFEHFSPFA